MTALVSDKVRVVTSVYSKADGRKIVRFSDGTRTSHARLIAAVKLGRPLLPEEVVHHINEDRSDDRFENLQVVASNGEHMRTCHDQVALGRRVAEARRPVCAGCGCAPADRSPGCNPCYQRHYLFKKKGDARFKQAACRGCGVAHDERTSGCETCATRFRMRAAA